MYVPPASAAESSTMPALYIVSCSSVEHWMSPVAQPAPKNTPFQAECTTTENHPLPLAHVLRLKKSDGRTNSQLPNASCATSRFGVLKMCSTAHSAPVT